MDRKRWKVLRLEGSGVYNGHRIHLDTLQGGSWLVSLVKVGASKPGAAGPPVENVPGEYRSAEEAISAAKRYIDGVVVTSANDASLNARLGQAHRVLNQ